MVVPTRGLRVGVRTNFVQEPRGLQCLTKMWATCVMEDVSKYLDILTLEFSTIWKNPPSLLRCKQMLRRLLVPTRLSCNDIQYNCGRQL